MKYLITGKNGQLAQAFIKRFKGRSIDFSAPDESQLDITDYNTAINVVTAYRPDVIINCAAYNLVDKAEQDKDGVFAVNATGPKNLARAAAITEGAPRAFRVGLCFRRTEGERSVHRERSGESLNEYGKSKLAGEQHVMEELDRYLVLRLSWVFGAGKQNFIYKLTEWAKNNEYLKIACDEFSVPTYTGMVVDVTLKALEQGMTGRYHLTNSGFCSRYEWAKLILKRPG